MDAGRLTVGQRAGKAGTSQRVVYPRDSRSSLRDLDELTDQ